MMIVSITTGLPLAQAGRVRALAVFAGALAAHAGVPTAAEQGFAHLDLNVDGPRGARGHAARHPGAPACRDRRDPGAETFAGRARGPRNRGTSSAFGRAIKADYERWGVVIRSISRQLTV
jgi:hypothetical protein